MKQTPLLVEYLTNLSLGQKYTLLGKIYWRKLVAVFTVIWSAMITVFEAMTHPFSIFTDSEPRTISYLCPYCSWEFKSQNKLQKHIADHKQARLRTSEVAQLVLPDANKTYYCITCGKKMSSIWDTKCSRCGETSCYLCSVTLNDKQWLCRKCANEIEKEAMKAKELSRPLYYSYDVSDKVSHLVQRNDR